MVLRFEGSSGQAPSFNTQFRGQGCLAVLKALQSSVVLSEGFLISLCDEKGRAVQRHLRASTGLRGCPHSRDASGILGERKQEWIQGRRIERAPS